MSATNTSPTVPAAEVNYRVTPHAYVSMNVSGWRTCKLCGGGANAERHKGHR